jgi:cell division protein ZapA
MAEDSKEKLNIRLHVYDEFINVTIQRDEEQIYRDAAKLITERYGVYTQRFKLSKGDHVVALMTLVEIALRYQQERLRNDTTPYNDILSQLSSEIEEALK